MYRRFSLLYTLILVAGMILGVAFTSHGQPVIGIAASSANIITAATTPRPPGTRRGSAYVAANTEHYYLVIHTDGSMEYEVMSKGEEQDRFKTMRDAYKEETEAYNNLRKQWVAAFGNKTFPVEKPKLPQILEKGTLSTSDKGRATAEARHEAELEQYVVCIVSDTEGAKTAEVIRRDQVTTRKNELNKKFVETALAEAEQGSVTVKQPELNQVGSAMSKDAAEKSVTKIQAKLDAKGQEADKSQPAGNSEPADSSGTDATPADTQEPPE